MKLRILLFSLVLLVLLISNAFSQTETTRPTITLPPGPDIGQILSPLKDLFGRVEFENFLGIPVPKTVSTLLVALGFPQELAENWITLFLYILFPLILFTIIVHDIVFTGLEELLPTLKKKGGLTWLLSFFMVLALVPIGVVGPFLLWIYLNAASFALWGAGIFLVLIVVGKVMSKISGQLGSTTKGKVGRFILLCAILVVFFIPSWQGFWLSIGLYIVLIIGTGILMGIFEPIFNFFRRRKIEKNIEEGEKAREDLMKLFKENLDKVIESCDKDAVQANEAFKKLRDTADKMTLSSETKDKLDSLAKLITYGNLDSAKEKAQELKNELFKK